MGHVHSETKPTMRICSHGTLGWRKKKSMKDEEEKVERGEGVWKKEKGIHKLTSLGSREINASSFSGPLQLCNTQDRGKVKKNSELPQAPALLWQPTH
uniref:Uncharacterized protein n=1 Tax=Myripristis murdjan TaxID=586833 RepID=A0A667X8M6_9TELE